MIWIWRARTPGARLARLALLPAAAVFHVTAGARAKAYRSGWLPSGRLPEPSVAVGSLAVGGAGKTPLAAWIAGYYARSGLTPAILLRGYGGDEADVHRRAVPRAVVIEHADRVRAARRAVARGADVLVLDDAFQRLDIRRDLNVAVAGVHRLQHIEGLGSATFADNDPIGPHAQAVDEQVANRDPSLPLDVGRPGFETHDMRLAQLKLSGVLDGHDPVGVGNEG